MTHPLAAILEVIRMLATVAAHNTVWSGSLQANWLAALDKTSSLDTNVLFQAIDFMFKMTNSLNIILQASQGFLASYIF